MSYPTSKLPTAHRIKSKFFFQAHQALRMEADFLSCSLLPYSAKSAFCSSEVHLLSPHGLFPLHDPPPSLSHCLCPSLTLSNQHGLTLWGVCQSSASISWRSCNIPEAHSASPLQHITQGTTNNWFLQKLFNICLPNEKFHKGRGSSWPCH